MSILLLFGGGPPAPPAAAEILDVYLAACLTTHQTVPGNPTGITTPSEVDDFNITLPLGPASTPVVSELIVYPILTIGGGGTTDIDLTAAQGSDGAVDCSGKKLIALLLDCQAIAHQVAVTTGAANGYTLNGATCHPGGFILLGPLAAGIAVDGTHKVIRLTGTAAETPKLAALFG